MTSRNVMRRITLCAFAVCVCAAACSTTDITGDPSVADMRGREYRIVGEVDAYGVKAELDDKEASFVELIPLGISGPEILFKKRLPRGQTFRIRKARRAFKPFENGIEYVVELSTPDWPPDLEVFVRDAGQRERRYRFESAPVRAGSQMSDDVLDGAHRTHLPIASCEHLHVNHEQRA
jgi:hypothetical protein